LFFLPSSFFSTVALGYDHMAHEFMRLYGIINIAVGWLVYRLGPMTDGRISQAISEAFSVCYIAHSIVMFRAQFTNPAGHSFFHWLLALLFGILGGLYIYVRFVKKIKYFELPGIHET
jgi:Zn-dependent protease